MGVPRLFLCVFFLAVSAGHISATQPEHLMGWPYWYSYARAFVQPATMRADANLHFMVHTGAGLYQYSRHLGIAVYRDDTTPFPGEPWQDTPLWAGAELLGGTREGFPTHFRDRHGVTHRLIYGFQAYTENMTVSSGPVVFPDHFIPRDGEPFLGRPAIKPGMYGVLGIYQDKRSLVWGVGRSVMVYVSGGRVDPEVATPEETVDDILLAQGRIKYRRVLAFPRAEGRFVRDGTAMAVYSNGSSGHAGAFTYYGHYHYRPYPADLSGTLHDADDGAPVFIRYIPLSDEPRRHAPEYTSRRPDYFLGSDYSTDSKIWLWSGDTKEDYRSQMNEYSYFFGWGLRFSAPKEGGSTYDHLAGRSWLYPNFRWRVNTAAGMYGWSAMGFDPSLFPCLFRYETWSWKRWAGGSATAGLDQPFPMTGDPWTYDTAAILPMEYMDKGNDKTTFKVFPYPTVELRNAVRQDTGAPVTRRTSRLLFHTERDWGDIGEVTSSGGPLTIRVHDPYPNSRYFVLDVASGWSTYLVSEPATPAVRASADLTGVDDDPPAYIDLSLADMPHEMLWSQWIPWANSWGGRPWERGQTSEHDLLVVAQMPVIVPYGDNGWDGCDWGSMMRFSLNWGWHPSGVSGPLTVANDEGARHAILGLGPFTVPGAGPAAYTVNVLARLKLKYAPPPFEIRTMTGE